MERRKKKEDKLTVKPSKQKDELTTRRPLNLWSEMDDMFENFRSQVDNLLWPWGHRSEPITTMTEKRTPPMDVADMGDHYEMKVEMPGIPKKDINIEVTPTTVEISAQHEESKEGKDKNWLRRERSSVSFYRAVELPEELRTENIDAELQDGVLKLQLPKVEPQPKYKPKKIKIK